MLINSASDKLSVSKTQFNTQQSQDEWRGSRGGPRQKQHEATEQTAKQHAVKLSRGETNMDSQEKDTLKELINTLKSDAVSVFTFHF